MSNRSGRTAIASAAAEFQAAFDMSRLPTANELLERLRAIYEEQAEESLSDEKLAGRLPISLSTFNRWKKGDTKRFTDIVKMLDKAGWLSTDAASRSDAEDPDDPLVKLAALIVELGENQKSFLEEIRSDHLRTPRAGATATRGSSNPRVPKPKKDPP